MIGVYVHVPYCIKKCNYCDFYSIKTQERVPQNYVDALIKDISATLEGINVLPDTVYFGGGTPCLMTPVQIKSIIDAINPKSAAQITLEANPKATDEAQLTGYLNAGVNRLSLGVQTAGEQSLVRLGRCHTSSDSILALRAAKSAGFKDISGDIMLALPNYTMGEMTRTIELLSDNGCTHISSYMLKIENNTPFAKAPPQNLPDDDEAADYYLACVSELNKLGYMQYEISNFAKPGFESLHNLLYWNCEDYLGFGPSAHSCFNGRRYYYKKDVTAYINNTSKPIFDAQMTAEDYIMLQLRLNKGLSLKALGNKFGISATNKLNSVCNMLKKAQYLTYTDNIIALTPKGMLLQNSILYEILQCFNV